MSVSRTIARNSMFTFITTGVDTFTAFVAGIILARYLGTEQYGLYSLMMWFLSLASTIVDLGMGDMVKRFIAEAVGQKNITAAKGIVRLVLVARGVAAIISSILILGLSTLLAKLFNVPADGFYFMLVAAIFIPSILSSSIGSVFQGFQKYDYSTYIATIGSLLKTALTILLLVMGYGVKEILELNIGISILCMVIAFFLLSRLFPIRALLLPSLLEPERKKSALKFSIAAMAILAVDYFLWQQAEVMFLGIYQPVEQVGFYRMAHRIPGMMISLIPFVLGRVLLPAVSEQYGKGDMDKIKAIFTTSGRYLMILSFPIATAGIALARPLIIVLFGQEYEPAIILMQAVFIPFATRGIIHAVTSVIYGIQEPVFLLKIGAILIVVSIGLNLLLIPRMGTMGAVIGTSIPRILALPLYINFVSRKIKVSWPLGDTLRIALASVIMGAIVFVVQYFTNNILGLVLGVVVGLITYGAAILLLRLIKSQDIRILRQIEERVPSNFRRSVSAIIVLVARFARKN